MNSSNSSRSLDRLNHTELYQTCQYAGYKIHPALNRQQLISILLGDSTPAELSEETHPIDTWRLGIIGFLEEHWAVLEPQLKCPAKNLKHPTNPNPKPCFTCLDTQVATCIVLNKQMEERIAAHKPKGTP